jgi:hypothetical protein
MGAAAPASIVESAPEPQVSSRSEAKPEAEENLQAETQVPVTGQASLVQPANSSLPMQRLQSAVLQALTDGNQRILVSMLEAGEWTVEGNELVIRVSESQTVVDMSLGADGRRLAIASASGVLGRAVKLKIVPGAAATEKRNGGSSGLNGENLGAGGRSRAEQDPIVRRLREKFGAEIRTVIDYKDKR